MFWAFLESLTTENNYLIPQLHRERSQFLQCINVCMFGGSAVSTFDVINSEFWKLLTMSLDLLRWLRTHSSYCFVPPNPLTQQHQCPPPTHTHTHTVYICMHVCIDMPYFYCFLGTGTLTVQSMWMTLSFCVFVHPNMCKGHMDLCLSVICRAPLAHWGCLILPVVGVVKHWWHNQIQPFVCLNMKAEIARDHSFWWVQMLS